MPTTPRYMLLEAGATSPQWFDSGVKLLERVRAITTCATAATVGHIAPPTSLWIDVETRGATEEVRRVLSELPLCEEGAIPASVRSALLDCGDVDAVELQTIAGSYVRGALKCLTQHPSLSACLTELRVCAGADETSGLQDSHTHATRRHEDSSEHTNTSLREEAMRSMEMEETMCGFLVTRRVAVTVHATPFLGLKELLWTMTHTAGSAATPQYAAAQPLHAVQNVGNEAARTETAKAHAQGNGDSCALMWFTSVVLSHLICYTTEIMIPDPSVILPEINIDAEIALFVVPCDEDQSDLLYRISMARRSIADMRMRAHLRESIVRRFMTSAYRTSFLCQDEGRTLRLYRDAAEKLHGVNNQLNDMHKTLNQINLNYITSSSMRIVQLSANMSVLMMIFSEVAVMCLPLHVFVCMLGMNVRIPYDKSINTSQNAFWSIISFMLVYLILLGVKIGRTYATMEKNQSLVPNL